MKTMNYLEAGREGLAEMMREDVSVWALGEDLGRGGVFGQYHGLQEEFGKDRIADTPISESCILGSAVGAAMMGTRPVVEMRFADFALCAVDELVNQAAKARYMFGGQARVPMVVREPSGMWRSSAAQHSQSLESWYTHIPGLVVVMPSTPADNKSLLMDSIRCDDPVVYLEHKDLWGLEGPVDDGSETLPIGKARVARSGTEITIVSWSAMFHQAMEAADKLSEQNVEAEVIDLRTLWPWDKQCVFESVRKTGHLMVVHEAVQVSGFGAEISATVAENIFRDLKSAPQRLAAPRIPVSYAPTMENEVRISADQIVEAALKQIGK